MNDSKNTELIDDAWKKDGHTLRVKGGDPNDPDARKRPTDPVGLSRSILHVLRNNDDSYVKLQSVGPVALNIVMTAFRIAADEIEKKTDGWVLVARQSEDLAVINDKTTKRICTRVFAIPIKYAL